MPLVNPNCKPQAYKPPYNTLDEFYPFYLGEHSLQICRRLHVLGTFLFLSFLFYSIITLQPYYLIFCPLSGYGCAWLGHLIEQNKPATFKHPILSFLGDLRLFWEIITLQRPF
ncbi:putative membrane protein [Conidiobolus coronatus NRRL 28638]|uniref:Putative membrane protein n=1 Tax=Conidiobolus coronatus (strain ATCC 28846 / CBS 209.66 / NRRL 28638) TaxID=796925 RepID=A0A137PF02_CONC2|nr:putative membrane protein [Conidiobolus coronatus NRRL 28638]|eukprot:KXN73557.1 putative membrane protein [Conidiobolus coronatus NRRL 28638]